MTDKQMHFISEIYSECTDKKIYNVTFYNSEPCKYFKLIHRQGDIRETWFSKIFKIHFPFCKEYYTEDIIQNIYNNKTISINTLLSVNKKFKFSNSDKEYPIWYNNGISVMFQKNNPYNNTDISISIYFIGNYFSVDEINEIINYLNNNKNESKFSPK